MANFSPDEIILYQASKNGNLTQMKSIFKKITNIKDGRGNTLLHNAAENGDLSMVNYLTSIGAEVNVQAIDDWTPLHCAAEKGHNEVAKYY